MKLLKAVKILVSTLFLFLVLTVGILVYVSGQSDIYGWRMLIVKSGSMEPTIKTGSLIFIQQQSSYDEGDVATFGSPARPETLMTHRIVGEEQTDNGEVYQTKGDFNQVADQDAVPEAAVLGEYKFGIPYLGYVISFAKTEVGVILLVVIPGTIIIYDELQNIRRVVASWMGSKSKKKTDEESESETDE